MIKKYVKIVSFFCALAFCLSVILYPMAKNSPYFAAASAEEKSFYTFLVCGADKSERNTDVMMLASLDIQNGRVNILQIPRDTFVNPTVSGLGVTRVNAVYAAALSAEEQGAERKKAAMERLCLFLENALCVEIDRYVLMSTGAFARAVDAIGGVEADVPFDMHYDDPAQGLHIHLEKGRQRLDGKAAEQFLRYRSGYATGDLGRVDARSGFLRTVLSQVKEKMTAASAAKIAAELAFSVTTDMGISEIARFAAFLHGVSDENVNIKTISGSAVQNPKTGAWIYYALNREAALADINEYIKPVGAEVALESFDKNAVFADDPHGENPYISKYYYSKIKKE